MTTDDVLKKNLYKILPLFADYHGLLVGHNAPCSHQGCWQGRCWQGQACSPNSLDWYRETHLCLPHGNLTQYWQWTSGSSWWCGHGVIWLSDLLSTMSHPPGSPYQSSCSRKLSSTSSLNGNLESLLSHICSYILPTISRSYSHMEEIKLSEFSGPSSHDIDMTQCHSIRWPSPLSTDVL